MHFQKVPEELYFHFKDADLFLVCERGFHPFGSGVSVNTSSTKRQLSVSQKYVLKCVQENNVVKSYCKIC